MNKLNPQQKRFVEEYLIDLNATQAAIRAGYKKETAYSQGGRLLKHVEVGKQIKLAMEKREEKVGIDAEWVLRQAVKLHEKCMQEVQVMIKGKDGKKGETGEYRFDSTGAGKALEIIGKHVDVQAFKEKHELSLKDESLSKHDPLLKEYLESDEGQEKMADLAQKAAKNQIEHKGG